MAEIGSGAGSSYPSALDTDAATEVNSPSIGKTKARAEVANDLSAAIIAIQTELGTDPAGSKTDVKTFLQAEHNADGTHSSAVAKKWTTVTAFTATPASTSTLTMTTDLTATILVGMPLKYVIGGTTYYGKVSAIAANLLTVHGAALGGDVTALYYGDSTRVTETVIIIPALYEDATSTGLIAGDLNSVVYWKKAKSYLVEYTVYSKTHDSTTHGKATVYVNAQDVNTSAGGLTIAADATEYSTVVDINTTYYDINHGEAIEIGATKAGAGDATHLTVHMTFVTP